MCYPALTLVAFAASTGMTAYSQRQAGMAESAAAEAEARQYDVQRRRTQVETSAAIRARFREALDLEAKNRLAVSLSGLAPDSFSAIFAGNRETAREDMRALEAGGQAQAQDLAIAGATARARGAAARRLGRTQALGTVIGAAFEYEVNRGIDMPSLVSLPGAAKKRFDAWRTG